MRPVAVRDVSQNQSKGGCETTSNSKIFDFPYMAPRPLGTKSVNVQFFSVGRPGLDPGTLGVFPEYPRTSLSVQICWSDNVECLPMSADILSRFNSWLDNWLPQGPFQGLATIQFRGADGEVFNLRLERGSQSSQTIL